MGNDLPALAGFFLASRGTIHFLTLAAMLIGLSLVIGSACVFNNVMDRRIDALMARTKSRALVTGHISVASALIFALVLGIGGTVILLLGTTPLAALLSVFGLFAYVIPYGYFKRRTTHGTLVGSISGAIPPVVGYVAVSGRLGAAAVILFVILVCWQMPHFFAIAIFRSKDYAAAHVPVLPVAKGVARAKIQMIAYIVAFIVACAALSLWKITGPVYLVISLVLGGIWLGMGLKKEPESGISAWAHGMFRMSLVVLTLLCLVISLDNVIR